MKIPSETWLSMMESYQALPYSYDTTERASQFVKLLVKAREEGLLKDSSPEQMLFVHLMELVIAQNIQIHAMQVAVDTLAKKHNPNVPNFTEQVYQGYKKLLGWKK